MTSRLDAALALAAEGFKVFPAKYNTNHPAFTGWQDDATDDEETVRQWFTGSSKNIGIATGPSGLLVVDIDVKKGDGVAEFKALAAGRPIPVTRQAVTPSGGRHLYYRGSVQSSAKKLAPNIDIRSVGGLVAAPGSVRDGKPYRFVNDAPIADAPAWLVELCGKPMERTRDINEPIEMDTETQVALATAFLRTAEPAVEGEGGDAHTLHIANRTLDYGVSVHTAAGLMLEHWNERCSPPWDFDALLEKVENAAAYRKTPIGCASPEADFDILDDGKRPVEALQPLRKFNPNAIPRRKWVAGRYLLQDYVTVLVAAPGAGKSTVSIAMALAVITGRKDITGLEIHRTGSVILINNEDDTEELQRRIWAALSHWKIDWSDIEGKLFVWSADRDAWKIAVRKNGALKPQLAEVDFETIRQRGVVLLIADPFLETHEADENDNREINQVGQMYRTLAKRAGVSVLLVHHTRKLGSSERSDNAAGNIEAARGASSLIGVARVGLTLHTMTRKDAEFYGVTEQKADNYVRLDHAKANLSKIAPHAAWFEKQEVILPNGDDVGVFVPVQMVSADKRETDAIAECLIRGFTESADREVSLNKACGWIGEDPLFSGSSTSSISTRVKKLFAEPVTRFGWTIELRSEQTGEKTRWFVSGSDDINATE